MGNDVSANEKKIVQVSSRLIAFLIVISLSQVAYGQWKTSEVECVQGPFGLAFVEVEVGESKLNFIVDSGSSHNVICETVISETQLAQSHEILGSENVRLMEELEIRIGDLYDSRGAPTLVLNLQELTKVCGVQVDGVLGLPFLEDKSLYLSRSGVWLSSDPSDRRHGEIEVIGYPDEFGRLYVTLNDLIVAPVLSAKALIDTGMNVSLSLNQDEFQGLCSRGSLYSVDHHQENYGFDDDKFGQRLVSTGRIAAAITGRDRLHFLQVCVSSENKLGMPLLTTCGVRINFRNCRLYLSAANHHTAGRE